MDAEAVVRPVVEGAGFEFVEVVHARETGRPVLRLVVDRPGGADLDALSELSRQVAHHLDLEGFESDPYELEVSTPGLERSLHEPAHFQRSVGEQVKVKTTAPLAGLKTHTGTLISADDVGVTIAVPSSQETSSRGTEELRVSYADIASARTVVDWDAEMKRSKA
jgi:ribosome maturation factor RimP